ncbi:MAG TPA: nuclear transport factor 2 family protein [Steroidobacteraceae bacterium]|nr:nuclear transport factor 2 family protein [Steroidobacteraceae bacterium]
MNPLVPKLKQPIAALALGWCVAAGLPAPAAEPRNPRTAPPSEARQELLNLETEWTAAEEKHDEEALRRILDDRFIATFGAARTYDKEAFIVLFTAGDTDASKSQTITDDAVIIDGDTAVLVGTDTARGTRDGVAYTVVYRYTTTYIRRHGHWVALAEHIVQAPQAK